MVLAAARQPQRLVRCLLDQRMARGCDTRCDSYRMHDEVIAEFRLRAEAALSFVDNTEKAGPFTLATSARSRLSGSGASRQEPGAASRARARRLHRDAGPGEWRQADALWAVQLAVPRREREDPARRMERGAVPGSRRLPRARP